MKETKTKPKDMTPRRVFEETIKLILEEPKRMDMGTFIRPKSYVENLPKRRRPTCNTVACFAGWACVAKYGWDQAGLRRHADRIEYKATEALGLTSLQAGDLFYVSNWPRDWRDKLWHMNPGSKAYAKVVAAYAKEFLAKIEKENQHAK